jgi:hypothetical protein
LGWERDTPTGYLTIFNANIIAAVICDLAVVKFIFNIIYVHINSSYYWHEFSFTAVLNKSEEI